MDFWWVGLVSLLVSALTFLSGFGLGTLLLPVFIFLLPNIKMAVAATAAVHLADNIFKALLIGKQADWKTVWRFAMPAALMAIVGALLLSWFANIPNITEYALVGHRFAITPIKLLVGVLMLTFGILEFRKNDKLSFPPKWVPFGGAVTGFFGGLTGHQGVLRAAFLLRTGLPKEAFIATAVVSSVSIDLARLLTYNATFISKDVNRLLEQGQMGLMGVSIGGALVGSISGYFLLKETKFKFMRYLIGALLLVYAVALGAGLI